jgi:hypothetical protein
MLVRDAYYTEQAFEHETGRVRTDRTAADEKPIATGWVMTAVGAYLAMGLGITSLIHWFA